MGSRLLVTGASQQTTSHCILWTRTNGHRWSLNQPDCHAIYPQHCGFDVSMPCLCVTRHDCDRKIFVFGHIVMMSARNLHNCFTVSVTVRTVKLPTNYRHTAMAGLVYLGFSPCQAIINVRSWCCLKRGLKYCENCGRTSILAVTQGGGIALFSGGHVMLETRNGGNWPINMPNIQLRASSVWSIFFSM